MPAVCGCGVRQGGLEPAAREQSALDTSNSDLEATIHELTQKLRKSEESNKNLTIYIDNLKKSYHKVFGNKQDNDKEDHQSSSLSKSLSMQQ